MVTAEQGTAIFRGNSGKIYNVDMYISDVVGAVVTFDAGSGASATSLGFWKCPENCVLMDLAVVTGNTVATTLIPTADGGQIPGIRFRTSLFLTTLSQRPSIALGFKQGTNFGLTQA